MPDTYNNRGLAKKNTGDYAGAIKDFTSAIKKRHLFADAYNNRGLAKIEIKDYEGAIADFTRGY